jgi:hypothetical protein
LDKSYLYTEAYKSFKIYRRETENLRSYLGDIRCCYFNIRPSLVDPPFYSFQYLPRNVFIWTDGDKSKYSYRGIVLSINLGTRHVEAVARACQDTFDNASFLFE